MADQNLKLGFIGAGQMTEALADGFVASQTVEVGSMRFFGTNAERNELFSRKYSPQCILPSFQSVFNECDVVVLSVKPHIMLKTLEQWRPAVQTNNVFVSVAAGITIDQISSGLGTDKIVRVMPNTPSKCRAGMSGISMGPAVDRALRNYLQELFESVGEVVFVEEDKLHAVTGLSGSGPAYVFMMIEALADGGVKAGLPRADAMRLAIQTVKGAAVMAAETGQHPGALKDAVASPAGTTIEAIAALESGKFRSTVINAVIASASRSRELSA